TGRGRRRGASASMDSVIFPRSCAFLGRTVRGLPCVAALDRFAHVTRAVLFRRSVLHQVLRGVLCAISPATRRALVNAFHDCFIGRIRLRGAQPFVYTDVAGYLDDADLVGDDLLDALQVAFGADPARKRHRASDYADFDVGLADQRVVAAQALVDQITQLAVRQLLETA